MVKSRLPHRRQGGGAQSAFELLRSRRSAAAMQANRDGQADESSCPANFEPEAQPGCHVVYLSAPWIVGQRRFKSLRCPDIVLDPETWLLSVYNSGDGIRSFFISFCYPMVTKAGEPLEMGTFRPDASRPPEQCTTLVLVVRPRTLMDVGYLVLPPGTRLKDIDIASDIKDVATHPDPQAFDEKNVYAFPLEGDRFLCTQGFNGHFTHFYSATHHALDLACEVGTPVLAVADGVVREVRDEETASGIYVSNLYKWNSVLLELDKGSFVEYVHIKPGSVVVKVGERVAARQKICESGETGFCPTPHLHIQVHASADAAAPTVRFGFRDASGNTYFPESGKYYGANGPCDPENM